MREKQGEVFKSGIGSEQTDLVLTASLSCVLQETNLHDLGLLDNEFAFLVLLSLLKGFLLFIQAETQSSFNLIYGGKTKNVPQEYSHNGQCKQNLGRQPTYFHPRTVLQLVQ